MKITLTHTLSFSLAIPSRALQHVLLSALGTPQQKIERWSISMPGFAEAVTFRDAFGNRAQLVSQVKPEDPILVTVSGVVETTDKAGVLGRLDYDPMPAIFRRPTALTKAAPALVDGLTNDGGRIAMLHELMDRVNRAFSLSAPVGAAETQSQNQSQGEQSQPEEPPEPGEVPKENPADFAHALIGAARALDIPARYVTGYLAGDAGTASFHAWAECWDERLGWIGFDAMFNLCPADSYIRLAAGLDAMGTLPLRCVPAWPEMPVETVEMVVT